MTVLYLVRHGETLWNREERIQGHTDIPLTEVGRWQALRLADRLAEVQFAAAFTSDMQRTRDTARLVLNGRGLAATETPDLRERGWGPLEGVTAEERRQRFPQYAPAYPGAPTPTPPGAESVEDVAERARRVRRLLERAGGGDILVVSHGGFLGVLLCDFLGLPLELRSRLRFNTASLSQLELLEDRAVMFRLNDTCHLDGEPPR